MDPDELTDLVFPEPDPLEVDSDAAAHAEPRPVDRFRRTAAGTVVAAGLLGLRDALEGRPEKEEVTIVSEAPTRPEDGLTLVFDADDPSRVTVVLPNPPKPDSE
ncbi:MAG TPA: hypothetical protein VIH82_13330 [Acidimicrobiia bacterium]|jgi:hypothetical protein